MVRNQEFLHCISLLPQGKSKTGIFLRLSKNAQNATDQINYGVARCLCSYTLAVPNQFRYPARGQTSQTPDSEMNIQSGLLLGS